MEFKVLADTLASLAAFVAIVAAMFSWYRSAQRPLKVDRVVVHKGANGTTFIIIMENIKGYPVQIRRIDCYRRKKYQVQRKHGGKPEYAELFPGSEQLFTSRSDHEIPANGRTDIRVMLQQRLDPPGKLLLLLETSHGYHELWCKDIDVVEIGQTEVYSVEYRYDFSSRLKARSYYYWKLVVELTRRCSRRLRHG